MLHFIATFFCETVVRLTIAGSAVSLFLLILAPLIRRFFPAGWFFRLLTAALLFFAIPFYLLIPELQGRMEPIYVAPTEIPLLTGIDISTPAYGMAPEAVEKLSNFLSIYWGIIYTVATTWLVVVLLLAFVQLMRGVRFTTALKRTSHPIKEESILHVYEDAAKELGLRKRPELIRCSHIGTPMLTGLLHPALYLPEMEISEEQLRLVLLHELTHYRKGDLWVKCVMLVVGTIHWMNPVCFFLRRQLDFQCELSCDEALSTRMSQEERYTYGMTVLELMGQTFSPACTAFSKRGNRFKARLSAVMAPKKKSKPLRISCGVLSVLLTAAGVCVSSAVGTSNTFSLDEAGSIGIIGGADGPTAIFVSSASKSEINSSSASDTGVPADADSEIKNTAATTVLDGLSFAAPIQNNRSAIVGFDGYPGHKGLDYAAPKGTDIVAAADGIVSLRDEMQDIYGNYLIIDHGSGVSTLYAQCDTLLVSVGDKVTAGQTIATCGTSGNSTGPHCHFELRVNGMPVDSTPYMES